MSRKERIKFFSLKSTLSRKSSLKICQVHVSQFSMGHIRNLFPWRPHLERKYFILHILLLYNIYNNILYNIYNNILKYFILDFSLIFLRRIFSCRLFPHVRCGISQKSSALDKFSSSIRRSSKLKNSISPSFDSFQSHLRHNSAICLPETPCVHNQQSAAEQQLFAQLPDAEYITPCVTKRNSGCRQKRTNVSSVEAQ